MGFDTWQGKTLFHTLSGSNTALIPFLVYLIWIIWLFTVFILTNGIQSILMFTVLEK